MKKRWKITAVMSALIFNVGMMYGCGAQDTIPKETVTESVGQPAKVETEENVTGTEAQEHKMSNNLKAETEPETEEKYTEEQPALKTDNCFVVEWEDAVVKLEEADFEEYNIIAIPVGVGCDVDLDGNGTLEEIVYEPQSSDGVNYEFLFDIRDTEEEMFTGGMDGWNITKMCWPSMDYYYVMDLDSTDSYRELVFLDEGPSEDPEFHFLRHHDGETFYLGSVFTDSSCEDLVIKGDGKITGSGRLSVLQTWNAPFTWVVENEKIQPADEEWYYPYDRTGFGQEIKLIKKISIYKEADLESETIDVKPSDEAVMFTCTDNKNWVQLKMGDVEGWIYLKEGLWMEIDGEEVPSEQVFDGLFFAG